MESAYARLGVKFRSIVPALLRVLTRLCLSAGTLFAGVRWSKQCRRNSQTARREQYRGPCQCRRKNMLGMNRRWLPEGREIETEHRQAPAKNREATLRNVCGKTPFSSFSISNRLNNNRVSFESRKKFGTTSNSRRYS